MDRDRLRQLVTAPYAAGPVLHPRDYADLRDAFPAVAVVARHVGDVVTAQADALDTVAWVALEHGLEVHVQRKWGSRFVGLELAEPLRGHPCPVIYEHHDDGRWLEW